MAGSGGRNTSPRRFTGVTHRDGRNLARERKRLINKIKKAWHGTCAVVSAYTRGLHPCHDALSALVEAANTVPITGFTLDGPRGPRRVAKPGIAILAARTQLPIVPNAFVAERCWRLSSWDRHPIQKPFSRIICAYAPPVPPPPDDSPEAVESTRLEVETRLNGLHESLEAELAASETQPS